VVAADGPTRCYALKQSCATIYPSERFELDLENQGNPLIVYLRPLMRPAMHGLQRLSAWATRMAEAIERRF
jgi:hypothetical protein